MTDTRLFRARLLAAFLFMAIWGGAWDIWWHGSVGRDSFWIAPHLMLYTSVMFSILLGWWTWWQRRTLEDGPVWRKVALALMVLFVAAPLDELWHQVFGKEAFGTPLVIWSPPHLMIVFGLLTSFLYLLPLLLEDEEDAKRVFVPLALAGVLHLLMFLVMPFDPLGAYHIVGFWGAFAGALVLAYVFCFSRDRYRGFGVAFLVSLMYLVGSSVRFGQDLLLDTGVPLHENAPPFLALLALFVPAIAFDLLWGRRSKLVLGGLVGFFHAALLYGFTSQFLAPEFMYGANEMIMAVAAGTVGGLLGAFFSKIKFLS